MQYFIKVQDYPGRVLIYHGLTELPNLRASFTTQPFRPNHVDFLDLDRLELTELEGDKHDLALEFVHEYISNRPAYVRICLELCLTDYVRPTIFPNPLPNINLLAFVGVSDMNILHNWYYSITTDHVGQLRVFIDPDETIEGIGMHPMAQQAHSFEVCGGWTDITDEQLDQFQATAISFRSRFVTRNGIRRFIEKAYNDPTLPEDSAVIMCRFQLEEPVEQENIVAYCLDQFVSRDIQYDFTVEGICRVRQFGDEDMRQ